MYDVAVIGSGPAGASAAYALAKSGRHVVLIERERLPRYKTCGGGILGRATRLLPFNIDSVIERQCRRVDLNLLASGQSFTVQREAPVVSMTMRAQFDQLLVQYAASAGAEVLEACRVVRLAVRDGSVALETTREPIEARYVIAADGASGFCAKAIGLPETRQLAPAIECELRVGASELERLSHSARFDFDLAPSGYTWVFPKRDHLSIGAMTTLRGEVDLNTVFRKYLAILHIKDVLAADRHGYVIPLSPRRGRFGTARVLLTGDAAGLADPLTAEGITFAIRSGQLAASAIARAISTHSSALDRYEALLAREILPELRAGGLLARLLFNWPRARGALFKLAGQTVSELMTDVVSGTRTYTQILAGEANFLGLLQAAAHGMSRQLHGQNRSMSHPVARR